MELVAALTISYATFDEKERSVMRLLSKVSRRGRQGLQQRTRGRAACAAAAAVEILESRQLLADLIDFKHVDAPEYGGYYPDTGEVYQHRPETGLYYGW